MASITCSCLTSRRGRTQPCMMPTLRWVALAHHAPHTHAGHCGGSRGGLSLQQHASCRSPIRGAARLQGWEAVVEAEQAGQWVTFMGLDVIQSGECHAEARSGSAWVCYGHGADTLAAYAMGSMCAP